MSSALKRGRTGDYDAMVRAEKWRQNRIKELQKLRELNRKEIAEARRLTCRQDFWNYGKWKYRRPDANM